MSKLALNLISFYSIIILTQVINYIANPSNKNRLRYIILLISLIGYVLASDIFPTNKLVLPLHIQIIIEWITAFILCMYLIYFVNSFFDLTSVRGKIMKVMFWMLLVPFIFVFIIPYYITQELFLVKRIFLFIPFVFSVWYILFINHHLIRSNLKDNKLISHFRIKLFGVNLCFLSLLGLIVSAYLDFNRIQEHIVANSGFIILAFIYFFILILDTQSDYQKLAKNEEKLRDLNITLQEKIKERTTKIQKSNELLTNTFINLTHEIRTPLTLMNNSLEEYMRNKRENNLEVVQANLQNLNKNINNIFNIERFKRGLQVFNHDKISDFSKLVTKSVKLFRPYASSKRIEIIDNITAAIYTKADPEAIEMIISNLIDNSIKYTPDNGTIQVKLTIKNEYVSFTVKDNGHGIPKSKQLQIFKPYVQILCEKKSGQGLGMGLSIVKSIISGLDGEISLYSKKGEGSEFEVILKKHQLSDNEKTTDYAIQIQGHTILDTSELLDAISNKKYSVLVVEDEPTMRAYLRTKLMVNYNVYLAENGAVALERLKNIPKLPDLVISDIMMDEIDGYELLETMSESPDYNFIPIILLTAKTTMKDKLRGLEFGAVDFIHKPFSIEELLNKIEVLLIKSDYQRKAFFNEVYKTAVDKMGLRKENIKIDMNTFKNSIAKYGITQRESEIIELLSQEFDNKNIADKLFISSRTVDKHIQNIYEKTKVNKKDDLIKKFIWGS